MRISLAEVMDWGVWRLAWLGGLGKRGPGDREQARASMTRVTYRYQAL